MSKPSPKGVQLPASSGIKAQKKISLAMVVVQLAFLDGYELWEWPSDKKISDPVWTIVRNPDKPVCYRRKSKILKLAPKISLSPEQKDPITVSLRAVSSSPAIIFRKDGIKMSGSLISLKDVPVVSGELEDKVKVVSLTLKWSYSTDGGNTWLPMISTGPHKIYQVHESPKEKKLYDLALEKACGYVNGDINVVDKINKGIDKDIRYDPAAYIAGHPLKIYDTKKCLCMNNAKLMRHLCRSIGIDADVTYVWGGRAADEVLFYHSQSGRYYGSFQVLAPKNGDADKDPHFTYHAETVVGGTTYDPSYGSTGLINLEETAPGASRQTGSKWPPSKRLEVDKTGWTCPH